MNRKLKQGALLALASTTIVGCKKYDENTGPALKTAKKRLVGSWLLTETEDFDFKEFLTLKGEVIFEFEKDGDVNFSQKGTLTYTDTHYGYYGAYEYVHTIEVDQNNVGFWEFENKKEEIEVDFEYGTEDFEILKLTNTKLVLEDEENERWEFSKTTQK